MRETPPTWSCPMMAPATLPWRQWAELLMIDAASAALAIRGFFHDPANRHVASAAAAFQWLSHQWTTRPLDAEQTLSKLLLVLVGATGIETQLTLALLASDPVDAVRDIHDLARAADQLQWDDDACRPLNVALLEAAECFLARRDRHQPNSITARVRDALDLAGRRHCYDSTDADGSRNATSGLTQFVQLPTDLSESPLTRSKGGRELLHTVIDIAQLQQCTIQSQLAGFVADSSASADTTTDMLTSAAEVLIAKLAGPVATAATVADAPASSIEPTVQYSECQDHEDLIAYLRRGEAVSTHSGPATGIDHTLASNQYPAQPVSSVEALLEPTHASSTAEANKLVANLADELAVIEDMSVLSVRATTLLALQRRRQCTFLDLVSADVASHWEQQIQKSVNSLTGTEEDMVHLLVLLRLSAFHPSAVLRVALASALTSKQYHSVMVTLLGQNPKLAQWSSIPGSDHSDMLLAIRYAIDALVLDHSGADPSDCALVNFLVAISTHVDQTSLHTPLGFYDTLSADFIWDEIVARKCDELDSVDFSSLARLLLLANAYLTRALSLGSSLAPKTVDSSLRVVVEAYERSCGIGWSPLIANFRDACLILIRDLVSLLSSADITSRRHCKLVGDIRLETALTFDHLPPTCPDSVDPTSSLPPLRQASELHSQVKSVVTLDDSELPEVIERSLWTIVWSWNEQDCNQFSSAALNELSSIAAGRYARLQDTNSSGCVALIQNEVARMLASSGHDLSRRLIRCLRTVIIPALANAAQVNLLVVRTDQDELQSRELPLSGSGAAMQFIIRCWSLTALSQERQLGKQSTVFVLEMLQHCLVVVDNAVDASRSDPLGLLHCLQVASLIRTWMSEVDDEAISSLPTIRNRVEVVALRILFLLKDIPSTADADVPFIRLHAAQSLVRSGLNSSVAIAHFLQRTAGKM